MERAGDHRPILKRLSAELNWTRSSYFLLSLFLATVALIVVVWWPLAEDYLELIDRSRPVWVQLDWLLIGVFLVMSLLIMAGAHLKAAAWILLVGLVGGLVIESWGTQTELWTYYTQERPPLWIIPAWPIASLSIDRLVRLLDRFLPARDGGASDRSYRWGYWSLLLGFFGLMLFFVWPTLDKSLTWMALLLCSLLIATPTDHRLAVITFAAGAGLGYFLERWGTTRLCWTYYTTQTPPLFAVLAHGMAALAFWRSELLLRKLFGRLLGQSLGASVRGRSAPALQDSDGA